MGQKNGSPECGVLIIDIAKQEIVHRITIEGVVEELMDVVVIKNCHRPMLIGLKTDEIKNIFSFEPAQDQNNTNSYSNPILV